MPRNARSVVALAYEGLCMFEFGVVVEVFGLARPELDVPWYRFQVCSLEPGPLRATGGVTVHATAGLEALRRAGTIVIPGWRHPDEAPPEILVNALRRAHRRGVRLVSVCSGVFVLAAAGLLDGKRVTTHWRYAETLAARFPRIRVEPDVLYIDEGDILTSAGQRRRHRLVSPHRAARLRRRDCQQRGSPSRRAAASGRRAIAVCGRRRAA